MKVYRDLPTNNAILIFLVMTVSWWRVDPNESKRNTPTLIAPAQDWLQVC